MAKLNKVLLTSTALACAIALPAFAKKKDPSKAPKVVSSGKKMKLKMYGQITRTASIVDNGVATGFGNSENGNTSSRMGVTAEGDIDKSLKLKLRYEWNMRSAHDNRQQQNINDGLDNDFDIRHADIQFHHKRFGAIYFGRGHGPGNSSSQTDLSGTSTGAKGGGEHWDFQGGRMVETTASANGGRRSRVSPNIIYTNMDASNRSNRIRYDSPSIHGFQFRTGILDQDGYEFALWYKGKIAGWKIAGAINHSHGKQGLFPGEVRSSTTGTDTEISLYNGSISVQSPWGIGASGAGGFNVRSKTPAINNANDGNSPHFGGLQFGIGPSFSNSAKHVSSTASKRPSTICSKAMLRKRTDSQLYKISKIRAPTPMSDIVA